jgi:1,4-dihydroxy-2-naphthoyl-CoA hydrolase
MTGDKQDPAVAAIHSGFVELVGLVITEAGPDQVVGLLEIRPDLLQPYGILHGGVLCTLVETVGSLGAAAWFGDRGGVVGVSNSTDFIRATRDGTLRVVGTPIHRGRTSQLWVMEITDASQRLIARGQLRVANVENPDRLAAAPAR